MRICVLHVVDVSHPSWEEHLRVGDEVLEGLGVDRERELIVLNKIDLVGGRRPLAPGGRRAVNVSAVSGEGMDDLRSAIRSTLLSGPGSGDSQGAPRSGRDGPAGGESPAPARAPVS